MNSKKEKTLVPVCRCNNCMTYFHEDVTTCPKCKTDGYLMDLPELAAAGELADALENILREFVHVPGDIKGNKDRTTAARIIGGPNAALARAREALEKAGR